MKTKRKIMALMLSATLSVVLLLFGGALQPGLCQDQEDSIYYYAFLESRPVQPHGPIIDFLREQPLVKDMIANAQARAGKFRPMVHWFYWANQRQPFFPSLALILFTSILSWALLPAWMKRSQMKCRQNFWRSFFIGGFVALLIVIFMRSLFSTMIGWPLGVLSAGLLQLSLLCGLGVGTSLIGSSFGYLLRLPKWPLIGSRPDSLRFAELLIGALVCAALLQIGAPGNLPHVGTRLVALIALLGTGGLFLTRPGSNQPVP